ncbi:MAG: class I SAM-dependent methyltransferase [Promethearchaeota archaeon]
MAKKEILRVKGNIKEMYAKLSKPYAIIEEKFEKKIRERSLKLLNLQEGEKVLEIGFGTGVSLIEIQKAVGDSGKVHGIDLTPEMIEITRARLTRINLLDKIELAEGDARTLPYPDKFFDVVYLSSTLELFDTPDIPIVLSEIKRVLKSSGRLGVVSISKENHESSILIKIYEWFHQNFTRYASCRPIYVEDSVKSADFKIIKSEELMMGGMFPMKIIVAKLI